MHKQAFTPHHQNTPPKKQHNRVTAVHSGRETPGPIPNPEAKPASADDTTQKGGKVGHRRTQFSETPPEQSGGVSFSQSEFHYQQFNYPNCGCMTGARILYRWSMTGKAIPAGARPVVPWGPALRAAIAGAPAPRTARVRVEPDRPSLSTPPAARMAHS